MKGNPRPSLPLREYVEPKGLWLAIAKAIDCDMKPTNLSPVFCAAIGRLGLGIGMVPLPGKAGELANRSADFTIGVLMGVAIGRYSDVLVFKHERPARLSAASDEEG